jgi:hypothetical protein
MINFFTVIVLAIFFFLLLCFVYVYLVLRKIGTNLFQKRKKAWLEQNMNELQEYFVTGKRSYSFISRRCRPIELFQFEALEDFFSDYLSNFKIEPGFNPMKPFIEEYFVPWYKKRLFHSKWSTRMNTLYFIDLFKIEMMQGDLLKLLESKKCSPEERYQIYLLLADFGYAHLHDLFKESKGLPPFLLNEMISLVINLDSFESYVDIFYDLPYEWQLSILDVLRDKNFRSLKLQELLESLLNSIDREMRVRATKTIASLGYISSPDVITQILYEQSQREEWQSPQSTGEKLMYARLMGNIKTERFLPYLEQFISDKSYVIRSESAKAIRKYKNGREILLSITARHPDSFARNIAMEWLERNIDYE